jgi:hypothetical protein
MRLPILLWWSLGLSALTACQKDRTVNTIQVRVIWQENPETEAMIGWTTETAETATKVYYGPYSVGAIEEYPLEQPVTETGQYNSTLLFKANDNPFYNNAHLSGLEPDTKYYFRVQSGSSISKEFAFRTAPSTGPVSLLVGGDSRSDQFMRRKMNQVISEIWEEDSSVRALVHGGDYVEDGAIWDQWSIWFEDFQVVQSEDGEILPIVPTRGNHENDKVLYNQIFGFPGEDGSGYFKSKIGPMDFFILNTEESITGDQLNWLSEQLASSETRPWLFTSYHQPAFPVVKRPGAARNFWVPLFEQYQIDLAFESDGHAFKRTAPIYQEAIDHDKGIIYLGEGGLGVKQRNPETDRWYLQDSGLAFKKHHVMKLTVTEDTMQLTSIADDLEAFYEFQRSSRQQVRLQR